MNRWQQELLTFFKVIGLPQDLLRVVERDKKDLAHYALRCVDICYAFPFGVEEICGIAYRADVDLNAHFKHTRARRGVLRQTAIGEQAAAGGAAVRRGPGDASQSSESSLLPHVVEPSLGLERLLLALLLSGFVKDEVKGKERIYLNLHPAIAPFKAAVMPVVSNVEALTRQSERLWGVLRRNGLATILEDSSASIGRRYRRADELGVLYCVTVDDQTLRDNTVTVRWRNTAGQLRLHTRDLVNFICDRIRLRCTAD